MYANSSRSVANFCQASPGTASRLAFAMHNLVVRKGQDEIFVKTHTAS